ncbi:MAG TPA: hypothetical protein VF972_06390 [Actinomycetota bacterium]
MRRIFAVVLGAASLLAFAMPAGATTQSGTSSVINVYWVTKVPLGSNSYQQTTWYVGAYTDSQYGTSSDGYQEVDTCVFKDRRHVRCRQDSYMVGYTDLSRQGEYFNIDTQNLDYANLRGLYGLQAYDSNGNPTGSPQWTVITADVTGVGDVTQTTSKDIYHSGSCHSVSTYTEKDRPFSATGSENGTDLGTTKQGYFSVTSYTTVSHGCKYKKTG